MIELAVGFIVHCFDGDHGVVEQSRGLRRI